MDTDDPVTIALVAATAGAAVQGVSSLQQGRFAAKAARQSAQFSQELGERNAIAAEQQAGAEEARVRRDSQRRLGALRARFGASGFTFAGSPLEVLADQAMEAEEDALLVRHGGRTAAQQARLQGAVGFQRGQLSASIATQEANAAATGSFIQAGTSLLGAFPGSSPSTTFDPFAPGSGAISFGGGTVT